MTKVKKNTSVCTATKCCKSFIPQPRYYKHVCNQLCRYLKHEVEDFVENPASNSKITITKIYNSVCIVLD